MLDYPGVVRKFGSGATHAITCTSDEEVGDFQDSISNICGATLALFVSCRHDVVMTTREYARGRKCIPWTIPCVFAL